MAKSAIARLGCAAAAVCLAAPRCSGFTTMPLARTSITIARPALQPVVCSGWVSPRVKRAVYGPCMVTEGGQQTEERSSDITDSLGRIAEKINRDPVKLNILLNTLVVGAFVFAAFYKLAMVDQELSRGWTWWEIVLRVPGDNFWRYEVTVSESPVITKALTSCVAYGIGDFVAQLFQGRNMETLDLKRSARSAIAGLLIHGPMCHAWIQFMEKYLSFGGAWWNFLPKVVADQTGYSLVLNAAYTSMILVLQGKKPDEIWGEVKDTCWPALSSSWRFWPLIHCVSFSSLIPQDMKLLFIDFMEVIWVTILSTVANKDRQQDPELGDHIVGEEGLPVMAAEVQIEHEESEDYAKSHPHDQHHTGGVQAPVDNSADKMEINGGHNREEHSSDIARRERERIEA